MVKEDPLLGLPDAARRLDLHRSTLNDMVRDGRLPAERVGPHWFVRESQLEVFASTYRRPRNAPKRQGRPALDEWRDEILKLVDDWGSANADELATVLGIHVGNARKYLALLEHEGLVCRDQWGTWTLKQPVHV